MSNDNVIGTSADGKFRVRLVSDEECESPRWPGTLPHVVTVPNSRYVDVDKDGGPLGDGWDRIKRRDDAMDVFERWARIFHGAFTLRDTPERGASAVWYLMPTDTEDMDDPAAFLREEARTYRQWADGETYGYVVEELTGWTRKDGAGDRDTWEELDSCYGHIGYDFAKETARLALKNWSEG